MPRIQSSSVDLNDELLKPTEAAKIAKLSVSTLKDKRWRGTGPDYVKLSPGRGGRIRYPKSRLERWLAQGIREAA